MMLEFQVIRFFMILLMKGSLLATHGKLFILLQQRVWIERFVYTFHTIDWIQWHPVFHNYDFLHFPHTIKAWNTL